MGNDRDGQWGRTSGARPPLAPVAPLVWWAVTAVIVVAVVVGVVGTPGPLDDPRRGDQRAGVLIGAGDARVVRGLGLPGSPVGRRAVVVIFDRRAPTDAQIRAFAADVPRSAAVILVLAEGKPQAAGNVQAVADARGGLAAALGMPRPRDGGPPVGYAVIDRGGRVRYATLDPTYLEHGFEVGIVARALA